MRIHIKRIIFGILVFSMIMVPEVKVRAATDFEVTATHSPNTIQPYSDFTLTIYLKNTSDKDINDISIRILESEFSIKNSGSIKTISDIDIGKSGSISLSMTYKGKTSNKIPIELNYLKDGDSEYSTQKDYITVNAAIDTDDSSTPSTPTDTTKYKANLVISNKELPLVSSGKQQNVAFNIKNIGSYSASHVKITPDTTKSGTDKIRIAQQYLEPIDVIINTQKEQAFTLTVITDDGIEQGTYPIGLVVDYTNGWGDTFQQTILTYINVMKDGNLSSTVNVTQQSISNLKPKAGDSIDFNYTLKNVESGIVKNLEVWISGLPSDQFALMGNKPKINIRELRSGLTNNVSFNYRISEKAVSGSYPYKLNYQYINSSGYLVKKEVDYNIYISPNTTRGGSVEVKDLSYPGNIYQDESFEVAFNLANTGEVELKNIKVSLAENTIFFRKVLQLYR